MTKSDYINRETTSDAHTFITRTVINRINFPKREAVKMTRASSLRAKVRRHLAPSECDDVSQTVAFVLLRAAQFHAPMRAPDARPHHSPLAQ